jgi:hypothetical protein
LLFTVVTTENQFERSIIGAQNHEGLTDVGVHGREAPAFAVSDDVSDRGRGEMCPEDQDVAIGVVVDECLPRRQADLLIKVEVRADTGISELYRVMDDVASNGGFLSL